MKKPQHKFTIIGCDHRYIPENPFRKCSECDQTPNEGDCLTDILCGERYYVYKREAVQ